MNFRSHLVSYSIFFLAVILVFASCNTTDTGVSKPFPDCFDGILNQAELGIDCGGPCAPCPARITAKIDGVPWESAGNVTSSIASNNIVIQAGNGTTFLSFIHQGPFETGTYNLNSASYQIPADNKMYISSQGTITFDPWDDVAHLLSGTFSFTAFESSGIGDTIQVTEGKFEFVTYQP